MVLLLMKSEYIDRASCRFVVIASCTCCLRDQLIACGRSWRQSYVDSHELYQSFRY